MPEGATVTFTVSIENIPSGVPVQVTDSSGKVLASGTGSASMSFSEEFPNRGLYSPEYRAMTADGRWGKRMTSKVTVIEI